MILYTPTELYIIQNNCSSCLIEQYMYAIIIQYNGKSAYLFKRFLVQLH